MSSQADTMCISVGECVCVGVGVGVSSSHSGGGRRTRERRRYREDVEKTCSRCYWKGEDVDWHGSDTRLFTIQRACSRVTCVDLCGWEKKKKRKTALWVACRLLHPVVRVRGRWWLRQASSSGLSLRALKMEQLGLLSYVNSICGVFFVRFFCCCCCCCRSQALPRNGWNLSTASEKKKNWYN